jgi:tetratricopeptide (TPR) repeat protein
LAAAVAAEVVLILLASVNTPGSTITETDISQGTGDPSLSIQDQTTASGGSGENVVNAVSRLYRLRAETARTGWTFDAHRRAADFYVALGDPQTAAAHWEAALLERPEDAPTLRLLADYALAAEQWGQAVDLLEVYIRQVPGDTWGNTWLGVLYAPYNSIVAISWLENALRAESLPTGFDRETLQLLLDTLKALPPGDLSGALQVGIVLAEHDQWALAERAFRVAVAVGGGEAESLAYQGLARTMQGKPGAAYIKRALELGSDDAKVLYVVALYAQVINDGTATIDALMSAASLNPNDPALSAAIGQAFLINGLYNEAGEWLEYAVVQSNNDPKYVTMLEAFNLEYGPLFEAAAEALAAPTATPVPSNRHNPR